MNGALMVWRNRALYWIKIKPYDERTVFHNTNRESDGCDNHRAIEEFERAVAEYVKMQRREAIIELSVLGHDKVDWFTSRGYSKVSDQTYAKMINPLPNQSTATP